MHILDLVTDEHKPPRLSSAKLWLNVSHLMATVVFARQAWMGMLNYDIWLIYLGMLGTHNAAALFLTRGDRHVDRS
jgi:hypothetical protein